MIVEIKHRGIDSYTVYNKDAKAKIYTISKKSLMGSRYVIIKDSKNVCEIVRSPYDFKRVNITIGDKALGYISCDWTNRLDVKLNNGWYISSDKKIGVYQIRGYGELKAKVLCKYGLSVKYSVEVSSEESLLTICAIILALDIINYNEEKY